MNANSAWQNRANFATLVMWLIASLFMAASAWLWAGQDFKSYYAAARVWLAGRNPYDYATLAPVLLEITGSVGNAAFYYLPWFVWLVAPLATLPFQAARAAWLLFNWAVWSVALWQLSQWLGWPRVGWPRWLMFSLATLLFAWVTWRFEQVGILIFAAWVAVLHSLRRPASMWPGLWLAVLLFKPNLTLLPVMALLAWLARHRQWRPIFGFGAGLAGLLLVATLIQPTWYQPFLQPDFGRGLSDELDGPNTVVAQRLNTTLVDWLRMFQLNEGVVQIIYGVAVVLGLIVLAVAIWRTQSVLHLSVVALLVNFAITPYALQYDYPVLTVVLMWALALASRLALRPKLVSAALVAFIVSVLFWERPISDGYWMVLGLIALSLWAWQKTPVNGGIR